MAAAHKVCGKKDLRQVSEASHHRQAQPKRPVTPEFVESAAPAAFSVVQASCGDAGSRVFTNAT